MKKIRVLHFATDDKFFDSVFNSWEKDSRFQNQAILYVKNPRYKIHVIKNIEKVTLLTSEEMVIERLYKKDYDVLFFQPFSPGLWPLAKLIPNDKIVIWWGFGMELYQGQYGQPPLIDIELYKPITKTILRSSKDYALFLLKEWLKGKLIHRHFSNSIQEMLKRVDYYQPVIEDEYHLLQNHNSFKASEFYYNDSCPNGDSAIPTKSSNGNILLGNSATYTNNHCDIYKVLSGVDLHERKIIIPINYGYKWYKKHLIKTIKEPNCILLKDFLSKSEYFKLIDSCSYAILGVLRQQAVGNVNYCIKNGIKLFFYKDSLLYKYYIKKGFDVYAIEDMNEDSLCNPLTEEQNEKHRLLLKKEYERRKKIYENVIQDIQNKIIKHII